jgi:hypothetical protein
MRDFSKISPSVWRSTRFIALETDDARFLYLYYLTCEHQTSAGAYRVPDGYACDDLNWTRERYQDARQTLEVADLIAFDDLTSVVMVRRWFKHNPPMNESHLKGIERVIERLESEMIQEAVSMDLNEAWEAVLLAKAADDERKRKKDTAQLPPSQHPLNTQYLNGRGQRQ